MLNASCGQAFGFLVAAGARHFDVTTAAFLVWTTVWLLGGAIGLPIVGRLIDRWGVRRVVACAGIAAAASIGAMALAPRIDALYIAAALLAVPWVACTIVPASVVATRWNPRPRNGLILGLVASGSGVGGVLWGFIMPPLVANGGYVVGVLVLAAIVLALTMVGALVLIREPPPLPVPSAPAARRERLLGRSQLLLIAGSFLSGLELVYSALLPAILLGMGPRLDVGLVFGLFSIATIFVPPLLGAAHDRVGLARVLAALAAVNLALVPLAAVLRGSGPDWLVVVIPVTALVLGAPFVVLPLAISRRFGADRYATRFAMALAGVTAGMAVGAPVWGLVFDLTGHYDLALYVSGPLGVVAIGLIGRAVKARQSVAGTSGPR